MDIAPWETLATTIAPWESGANAAYNYTSNVGDALGNLWSTALSHAPWEAGAGMLQGAGEVGSGLLNSVTGALNRLLPGSPESKSDIDWQLQTDPILNYHSSDPTAQAATGLLGSVFSPLTSAASWANNRITAVGGEATAGIVSDLATLATGKVAAPWESTSDVPMSQLGAKATASNFKQWFGKSQVVDEDSKPLTVYHGTTGDFNSFSAKHANPESDWGAGFYFSNTPEDVSHNYAGEGPDLTNKIQNEAERIAGETDRSYDDPEVLAEARDNLSVQHQGASMPMYLRMENPIKLGGDNETRWHMDVDEDGNESGPLVDLHSALHAVAGEFYDFKPQEAFNEAFEKVGEDGTAHDYLDALKNSEGMQYATMGDNGKMAASEIVRRTVEHMGYDGIIDNNVDQKFGSQKRVGKPMEGMTPDTTHYIIFDPHQAKSAVGNSGKFSKSNPDITAQNQQQQGDSENA
jgi:hypothetical protein